MRSKIAIGVILFFSLAIVGCRSSKGPSSCQDCFLLLQDQLKRSADQRDCDETRRRLLSCSSTMPNELEQGLSSSRDPDTAIVSAYALAANPRPDAQEALVSFLCRKDLPRDVALSAKTAVTVDIRESLAKHGALVDSRNWISEMLQVRDCGYSSLFNTCAAIDKGRTLDYLRAKIRDLESNAEENDTRRLGLTTSLYQLGSEQDKERVTRLANSWKRSAKYAKSGDELASEVARIATLAKILHK